MNPSVLLPSCYYYWWINPQWTDASGKHMWLCNLFYCFGKSPCASMPFAAANRNSQIGFQFREERIYRSEWETVVVFGGRLIHMLLMRFLPFLPSSHLRKTDRVCSRETEDISKRRQSMLLLRQLHTCFLSNPLLQLLLILWYTSVCKPLLPLRRNPENTHHS
jgi:hypothetical protein